MFKFHATAPFEMEGIVAQELRTLGFADVEAETGGAVFSGDLTDALRANLWLRTAERVFLRMGRFTATSFDELFEGVSAIAWEEILPHDASVPVTAKCARSQLMSVPDTQAITKKAIVKRLQGHYGQGWLPETGARYAVDVHIHKDIVTISLDTSGAGLSRRGYRTWNGEAPLRETMAAALLMLSPWYTDQPLCDPMCGTGTIVIEAAMMAMDRAPGLMRAFDLERWPQMGANAAKLLRGEAQERAQAGKTCEIYGSDMDPKAIALTKKHVVQAGIGGKVRLECAPFQQRGPLPERGAFVLNPPYGVRLLDAKKVDVLYRELGQWYAQYPYWSLTAITAHKEFGRVFGRRADKIRKLYNGKIECSAYIYRGQRRPKPADV